MAVRWNDAEPEVFEVPRIEDELIDEMFYQEDEIGEMRHTAFMIECGLEEDPPDGPDVPPIPWKPEDLKKAAEEAAKKKEEEVSPPPPPTPKTSRKPPNRTHSMDEGLIELEEQLPQAARSPAPTRGIAPRNSVDLGNNRPLRRAPPSRTKSFDPYTNRKDKQQPHLSLGLARTEKASPAVGHTRKIAATKSGSLHTMRDSLRKVPEGKEGAPPPAPGHLTSPRKASRLVATKSGNLHGMRRSLRNLNEGADKEGEITEEPLRRGPPQRGNLGGSYVPRKGKRPERRDSKDSKSTMGEASTSSGDSFLSEFDSSWDDTDDDVSIATDASDDAPKPKPTNPKEILQQIKAEKEKKKRREKRRKEKREKKKAQGEDGEKKEKKSPTREKKPVRKFKVRKSTSDVPPAFRHF